ncbi:hypothetical protein [Bradyrhizobium cenepequi]|nr:hypothetical protein [Bradyrhizobium cenepequi]
MAQSERPGLVLGLGRISRFGAHAVVAAGNLHIFDKASVKLTQ